MIHKPTSEEKKIIRECAQRSSGYKRIEINPSTKVNLNDPSRGHHMNICFVSDDPEFRDTDLFDNAFEWRDFTRGFEMTEDGRAIIDFYVYSHPGENPELETNVTAYWEGGKLIRVDGTCNGTMWRAP